MLRNLVILGAIIGFVGGQTTPGPTPDPTFTCPSNADSVEAHPTDCTKFYECTHGDAWLFQCPDKLYFNPVTKQCDWPQNVDCKAKPTAQPKQIFEDFVCPKDCNVLYCFFPNPADCSTYYECSGDDAFLRHCPPGLVFHPQMLRCDWPQYVPECSAGLPNRLKLR